MSHQNQTVFTMNWEMVCLNGCQFSNNNTNSNIKLPYLAILITIPITTNELRRNGEYLVFCVEIILLFVVLSYFKTLDLDVICLLFSKDLERSLDLPDIFEKSNKEDTFFQWKTTLDNGPIFNHVQRDNGIHVLVYTLYSVCTNTGIHLKQ